jgi:peptidoglycan L-alanyl-D-glutamate endopeptidase CwlK
MLDKKSLERINFLHPEVVSEVIQILKECEASLTGRAFLRITHGLRTMAEQAELYAIGRTKPGKKVTNAKAGQSVHNYGFAVDICLIIDGKEASWDTKKDWDGDKVSDWDEVVKIFAKYGWSWGGSWTTFKDMPHFEKIGRNNWRVLATKKLDSNGYVII